MGISSWWSHRFAGRQGEDDAPTDRELVERLRAGDGAAFEHFFEHQVRAVFRYASAHLRGDPDEIDDVVQATMAHALDGLDRYRGDGPLAAWLVGICRYEISARRRRRRRGEHIDLDEDDPSLIERSADRAATPGRPDTDYEATERRRMVHVALDALPDRYRRALVGKYLEGLPVRQLAEDLGLSAKATESLLTRARVAFDRQFVASTAAPNRLVAELGRYDGG